MPLPGDVATRAVHGQWLDLAGAARSGVVTFTPSVGRLVDGAGHVVLTGGPVAGTLDEAGEISVVLPCTDDSDLTGTPFTYLVVVQLAGDPADVFHIEVPEGAEPLELANLTPVGAAAPAGSYVVSVNGMSGVVTGVGAGTPATAVTGATSFGQAPAVGDSANYARQNHSHGTPALGVTASTAAAGDHLHAGVYDPAGTAAAAVVSHQAARNHATHKDSGFITTGDVSVGTAFTQLGPDLSIAAAAGDVLEVDPEVMCHNAGADVQIEAVTRVAAADARFWSSGTAASRWPGGIARWYVATGAFTGPRGASRYVVQAGDVVAGSVTVRLYGRVPAGSRTVLANATYPLRWALANRGPAV